MFELVRPRYRRSLRRAVGAACQAVRLRGFGLVGERLLDLSPRGALLACDASVRPGDRLLLSFRAPGAGPIIDVEAEVARVVGGWRVGDRGYCAGLRFHIDAASRWALLESLAGSPPPVPQRRVPIDYAETVRRVGFGARA